MLPFSHAAWRGVAARSHNVAILACNEEESPAFAGGVVYLGTVAEEKSGDFLFFC